MKTINIKFIEVFTDGSLNFSYTNLNLPKQKIFYEKDARNSFSAKKSTKTQLFQNLQQNSYKLKYKF